MPTGNEISMLQTAIESGIESREELANFMAQISHESGGLVQLEESFRYTRGINQIPVRSAFREGPEVLEAARIDALAGRPQQLARLMYGGRMGNDDAGDGYRYRGRGFTQLTGEANYRAADAALNLGLVNQPDLAAEIDNASRIATWYWRDRVPLADRDDVSAATRAINGGEIGLADRYNRFDGWFAHLTPEFMVELRAGRVQAGAAVAPVFGPEAMTDGALRRGEAGPEVRELQENLRELGITADGNRSVGINNTFGPDTEQAVRQFQEREDLLVTGRAGQETLGAIENAIQHRQLGPPAVMRQNDPNVPDLPGHDQNLRNLPHHIPAEAPELEQVLLPAHELLQRSPRNDGHPNQATIRSLQEPSRSLHMHHGNYLPSQSAQVQSASLQLGSSGVQVEALQTDLRDLGYRNVRGQALGATSIFDGHTQNAVARFQDDMGLSPTGVADEATQRIAQAHAQERRRMAPQRQAAHVHEVGEHAASRDLRQQSNQVEGSVARALTIASPKSPTVLPFSDPLHRYHPLYAKAQERTLAAGYYFSEARLTQITEALVQGDFGTKGRPWELQMHRDGKRLCFNDPNTVIGGRAMVDVTLPEPSIAAVVGKVDAADERAATQRMEWQQQQVAQTQQGMQGPMLG